MLFVLTTAKMSAADLCVAENGTGGCYSTITDAINAAANGDRIIINPKAGNAPYAENLTITKTLQFLCNVEGSQYAVSGNITITPAANRVIVFIGMNNLTGNLTVTGNSPAGARCKISVMNCNFGNGTVSLDFDNLDVTVASCVFSNGSIAFRYGKAIGNDVTTISNPSYGVGQTGSIVVNNDATATNDSVLIVGNKIILTSGVYPTGIIFNSSNQYFYISNNVVTAPASLYCGIGTYSAKNTNLGRNTILNNTIAPSTTISYGIMVTTVTNSLHDIINNLIVATGGSNGVYITGGGPVQTSYNYMSNPLTLYGIIDDGTNNLSSNTTLDANYRPNSGTDAINGGSPDEAYYDINLTRNDAGAFGGSFTQDNFYPVTGAARVYLVRAPRKITLGSTLNVKGDSFDR